MATTAKLVRKADGLFVRDIGAEKVVYCAACERVAFLNATAALVFELCGEARDRSGIVAELLERFEVSESDAVGDVDRTVQLMIESGVLVEVPA